GCGGGTTSSLDLFYCRLRELVCGDVQLDADFAFAQNLDRLLSADQASGNEVSYCYLATLWECGCQIFNVDYLVGNLVWILKALELRQTHVNRHLATFEGSRNLTTCAGTLGTAAGSLALCCLTAANAGLRRVFTF